MTTRAQRDLRNLKTVSRTVETGQTGVLGRLVKDGNADGECQHCDDGVDGIGFLTALGDLEGAATDQVDVTLCMGAGIIPVLVGTGGATRGKWAKAVASGVTDATPAAAATGTAVNVFGIFAESGVAGDIVGLYPMRAWITEA